MSLLSYSFASGIALIILAVVYSLFQRNTTHFVFNRVCVLSIMAASLITPFATLPSLSSTKAVPLEIGELTLSAMSNEAAVAHHPINFLRIISFVYLTGVAIMTLRFIANLAFIIYLRTISDKKVFGTLTLRVHNRKNIPPMSWGGELFIEETALFGDRYELEMILVHENAHRRQLHWLDLMLSNIVLAINWYNPAAWVLQHELIAVHEYEADRIASGICGDKMKYQLLLIKRTAGIRYHSIADSLNHSSIKQRIKMMMKNETKGSARLRSLALLPAVAIALLISNSSCVKNAQEQVDENSKTDTAENPSIIIKDADGQPVDFSKDNAPLVIIDGEEGSMESIKQENITEMSLLPDAVAKEQYGDRGANGVILVSTISNSSCVKNDLEQAVQSSKSDNTENPPIRVMHYNQPVDFSKDNAPLVIIDGEEGSMESIDYRAIAAMSVLPDAVAKEKYGARGANGVILVTTKKAKKTTSASKDEDIVKAPAKVPEFEGGMAKLYKMLAEKIQYPEDAKNNGDQGKVVVELTVGRDGEIAYAKILRGVNESLDKEALAAIRRVKEAGGKFTPGYDADGKPVATTFALPISFKLQ